MNKISPVRTINNSIELKLTIYNNELYISLITSLSDNKLIFLIDTGSQVSLLKAKKILDAKINTKDTIEIIGIADKKTLNSLGRTRGFLDCNGFIIGHDFHVMHEDMYLKTDGLLGADFLIKYNTKIDILNKKLNLYSKEQDENTNNVNKINRLNLFRVRMPSQPKDHDNEYFEAITDYLNYETKVVRMIKQSPNNKNPSFYDNLDENTFTSSKYGRLKVNKIELDLESNPFSKFDFTNMKHVNIETIQHERFAHI